MNHRASTTKAKVAILTVSDTRSLEEDRSGAIAIEQLEEAGHKSVHHEIVCDEVNEIARFVTTWANDVHVDAIIVTGGTGPSRRDVTPDAIVPLMTTTMPGFGELFRQLSYEEIGSASMLSRADAGWIDVGKFRTPVFLLPGSPKAVLLAVSQLIAPQLGHMLDVCSLEVQT